MLIFISFSYRFCDMFCQNFEKKTCSVTTSLCVSLSFPTVHQLCALHLSNSWFISLLLPYISVCGSPSLTVSLCRSLSFLRETYWMSLLSISLLPKITRSHSPRRPCQEEDTVFTVYVFVRESMHVCLCICAYCKHSCVYVCEFICSAVLPFPALGMFKASSCAVRMCLSLSSKNTCSAFYQRAELGWPGTVQGWARIIKHQQILIHPDWNWLGLFAGLVWFGLVGHGGITARLRWIGATQGLEAVCGQIKLVMVLN